MNKHCMRVYVAGGRASNHRQYIVYMTDGSNWTSNAKNKCAVRQKIMRLIKDRFAGENMCSTIQCVVEVKNDS